MNRIFALLLTLVITISGYTLLSTHPANAQKVTIPSVPEFTTVLVDHSYYTPATTPSYTTDPYSGERKQVSPGYPSQLIANKSIEVRIKNQPFSPYKDSEGRNIRLYYNIRYKGSFGSDWTYDPFKPDGTSTFSYGGMEMTYLIPYTPSNTEYTTITYPLGIGSISSYGKQDFQVQTQIGYIKANGGELIQRLNGLTYNFIGQSSDWAPVQTVEITKASSQTSTPSTPTPSVPELPALTILPLLLSIFAIALIIKQRKRLS